MAMIQVLIQCILSAPNSNRCGGVHENGSARKRAPAWKRALQESPQGIEVCEEKGSDDSTGAEEGDGINNDNSEEGMGEEEEADMATEELADIAGMMEIRRQGRRRPNSGQRPDGARGLFVQDKQRLRSGS
ncbi:hypothetical protein SCP_0312540 [Sparassis crispa]|uniref:Uncharacterized protein n=1 Tax=Sparassis crispa TaxID=139825 RepID=A0A401GHC9_9APHY|nr:hypothetical protein SCP_0312430 [Sparassis crispa]XP_027612438.1 hypothetical protein SCP_0312540 [Sparassis crispa]GBE81514.1 hypothetical protein SCP_0312430 [Sparassis crispa]GBE81525.1 hypothetical protein SCP_0312540 [Sparassis crispa]